MLWKACVCLGFVVTLLAGCQQPQSPVIEEPDQTISITQWTNLTELFVEFPPFIVGREIALAVHLTDLASFQPVASDILTTSLERQDGQVLTVRTETPTVPGIYRPVVKPDAPGVYRLVFRRSPPGNRDVHDTIVAGMVTVVTTADDVSPKDEEPASAGITFLKEQQWRMEFATAPVSERVLQATLKLHAEVKPRSGGSAQLLAPVGGKSIFDGEDVPTMGRRVAPGELLAWVLPLRESAASRTELESAMKTTQAELDAVQQELARVQDLYKDRIVPKRRLEQAQKDVAVLHARLASVRSQLSLLDVNQAMHTKALSPTLERFTLRSPLAGTIVSASLTPGALVEAGQELFTIVDLERVWIEGRVFESDLAQVGRIERARFTAPALIEPFELSAPNARVITMGSVIDTATRSVPLIIETRNPREQLKIGMHGELFVPTGEPMPALAIPTTSVVDDKGVAVVFVQREGETFERRELILGIQSDGFVQVKTGLSAGERVVTQGAYRVHLASLSNDLPAHGHAH